MEWYEIGSSDVKIKVISDGKFIIEEGFECYLVVEVSWYGVCVYVVWLSE